MGNRARALLGATLTIVAFTAGVEASSAHSFDGRFTCASVYDSDADCYEGDGLAAVFVARHADVEYKVCLFTPAGAKKCSHKQTHAPGKPSPLGFFSSGLGVYRAVWLVHGHGVVDRAEMRLHSEGV